MLTVDYRLGVGQPAPNVTIQRLLHYRRHPDRIAITAIITFTIISAHNVVVVCPDPDMLYNNHAGLHDKPLCSYQTWPIHDDTLVLGVSLLF